jgi:hypothetical protein
LAKIVVTFVETTDSTTIQQVNTIQQQDNITKQISASLLDSLIRMDNPFMATETDTGRLMTVDHTAGILE